jgi:hypothetical protein
MASSQGPATWLKNLVCASEIPALSQISIITIWFLLLFFNSNYNPNITFFDQWIRAV